MKKKMVQGIGINDYADNIYIEGKTLKAYGLWGNLLRKTYNRYGMKRGEEEFCEEWLSFKNFNEWYELNYRYDLEKELRIQFRKMRGDVYRPEECCFLPKSICLFLSHERKTNSTGCVGVYAYKEKWITKIIYNGKRIYSGIFETKESAQVAYQKIRYQRAQEIKNELVNLGYSDKILSYIK